MKILVTGANGFLGSEVVLAAADAGHDVVAGVRPERPTSGYAWDGRAEPRSLSLRGGEQLVDALRGIDVVIHLAAAKSGDFDFQHANTVETTEALLTAMSKAGVTALVGISSFALYDYVGMPAWSLLDESSPLEPSPLQRDAYARAKLEQEALFLNFADAGNAVAILRPGIIYGPNELWQFCLGRRLGGKTWLRMGDPTAPLPLIFVRNCAEAIVTAANHVDTVGASPINLVDDDCPTRQAYIDALNRHPAIAMHVLPFPVSALRSLGGILGAPMRMMGRAPRLPGLLRPVDLAVRFKSFRYSNDAAGRRLDWSSSVQLDEAIASSVAAQSQSE